MTGCACGAKRPADCDCGFWRFVVREELDRRPGAQWTGIDGADDTDFRRVSWRDFEREPCARGCSQGYVCVAAPDGTFGWVMTRCPRCNS